MLIISKPEADRSPGGSPAKGTNRNPAHSSRNSPEPHPLLFLTSTSLRVGFKMKNCTDTLEIGSRAPAFSLEAANREATFALDGLLAKGTLILEFLRGTW